MKSFLQFILEAMTFSDAINFFGFDEIPHTKEELNKHFKKLALKYHPDAGGSEEKMKMLNQAKEILDKNFNKMLSSNNVSSTEKSRKEQEYERKKKTVEELTAAAFDSFDVNAYKTYIEGFFGVNFNVNKNVRLNVGYNGSHHHLTLSFTDDAKDKEIELDFSVSVFDAIDIIFNKRNLSSTDNTIRLSVQSFVYLDGKKQVLSKNKYYSTSDAKIFTDPSILLPKTKMKKFASGEARKNSKFSKRDFEAMFKTKFDAEVSPSGGQSWIYVPVGDYVVVIWRTAMKIGSAKSVWYYLEEIGKKTTSKWKKYDTFLDHKGLAAKFPGFSGVSVLENAHGFDFLTKALSEFKRTNDVDDFVKSYMKASSEKVYGEE